jgi:hypothetical protein
MRPLETIPGMGRGWIRENDGGGDFNYNIRTFVNVILYPQYINNGNKKFHLEKISTGV